MNRRSLLILIATVVLAAALLVGYFGYFQKPSRVVDQALTNLAQAQTEGFTTTINLANSDATQALLGEKGTVEVTLDGVFDRHPDKDSLLTNVALSAKTESVTLQVEGEARFVGDKTYFTIKKAPGTVPALNALKGQWIELPRGGASAVNKGNVSGPLFNNLQHQGQEAVDGVSTIKYHGIAQEAAVVRFMDGIAQILGTHLTDDQIKNIRDSVGKAKDVPVDLWVTPWGHELKQLVATVNAPNGNTINFKIMFRDRNKKVDIAAPQGAVTLQQALQPKK